jgi:chaperonin GroES
MDIQNIKVLRGGVGIPIIERTRARLAELIQYFMAKDAKIGIRPLGDRVVVKPADKNQERKLASGIIIPETADKEKPARGTVVAVGPGKYEDGKIAPMSVPVGDEVLFAKYGYDEVKVDGEEYFILSESSVLAVIK